jgi:titin
VKGYRLGLTVLCVSTVLIAVRVVPATPAAAARVLTVTTVTDKSPPCTNSSFSLRCALSQANTDKIGDTINFNIPRSQCTSTSGSCLITVTSALPRITASNVTVNGYSQPGSSANTVPFGSGNNAAIKIRVDGSRAPAGTDGLAVSGNSVTMRGLSVTGFIIGFSRTGQQRGGSGINILGSNDTVSGNYLGLLPDGTTAGPNQFAGVAVSSPGSAATIGTGAPADMNVLSGNGECTGGDCEGFGVYIWTGSGTVVSGNEIGTTANGTAALGNKATNIVVLGTGNTIGGTASGAGNVISAGGGNGLQLGAGGNTVAGNRIGTNAAGTATLGNKSHGISLDNGADSNTIGGTAAGAGNLISGNGDTGLVVGSMDNIVQGNKIGTDITGNLALGNGFVPSAIFLGQPINGTDGMVVCEGSNTLGGTAPGAGNLVSGNAGDGISLVSDGNTVQGNTVGTNAAGSTNLPNQIDGIGNNSNAFTGTGFCLQALQTGGSNNTIGGTIAGSGNVVSGNTGDGVDLVAGSGNTVAGNAVGTNAGGTALVGNGGSGIALGNGSVATVGGTVAGAGNIVAHNGGTGILIGTSASDSTTHVAVQRNLTFDNQGQGIDLAPAGTINCLTAPPGPNDYTPCPSITAASTTTISGTACAGCTVEVFVAGNSGNDQGHGEGQTLVGSTAASSTGSWSLPVPPGTLSSGQLVTATATTPASPGPAETSEYAANAAVN